MRWRPGLRSRAAATLAIDLRPFSLNRSREARRLLLLSVLRAQSYTTPLPLIRGKSGLFIFNLTFKEQPEEEGNKPLPTTTPSISGNTGILTTFTTTNNQF